MTICAQLEAKLLAILREEAGTLANVVGFREAAASGSIKETFGGKPEIRVTVSPGSADRYAAPVLEYGVSVAVNLDLEDDPAQGAFDTVSAIVETLVEDWNQSRNADIVSDAFTTDDFRVDGFRADGGNDTIDLSRESPRICTTYNFALKGVITR